MPKSQYQISCESQQKNYIRNEKLIRFKTSELTSIVLIMMANVCGRFTFIFCFILVEFTLIFRLYLSLSTIAAFRGRSNWFNSLSVYACFSRMKKKSNTLNIHTLLCIMDIYMGKRLIRKQIFALCTQPTRQR